jgi:glucose-1-phosphate adenylyltransferase
MDLRVDRGEGLASQTLALVLAGGNGTRLGELTRSRCKPAVPFACHYRNIDFTLSNCVNSQVRRIGVLTQYKAQSLIDHLTAAWSFLPRHLGQFLDVWPAQQRQTRTGYSGTADAVFQNLDLIHAQDAPYTLVLAGDHIYTMDYRRLLARHAVSGWDVTIACVPVPRQESAGFGVLEAGASGRVHSFIEKPDPAALTGSGQRVLASMGIYVFNTSYLAQRLIADAQRPHSTHDFGRDILPEAVRSDRVGVFAFVDEQGEPGYWRDVGTLEAYWRAHMELLTIAPPIDLYDPAWPIWTAPERRPPARVMGDSSQPGSVRNSLVGGGCVIRAATIHDSVLSSGIHVEDGAHLEEAVVLPDARIGANCRLRRVIIDAGAEIAAGTVAGLASGPPTLLSRETIADALPCVA